MKKILSLMSALVALLYPVSSFADAPAPTGLGELEALPPGAECVENNCRQFVPGPRVCSPVVEQTCEARRGIMKDCTCFTEEGFCYLDKDANGVPEPVSKSECRKMLRQLLGVSAHGGHAALYKQLKEHEERLDGFDVSVKSLREKDVAHDDRLDGLDASATEGKKHDEVQDTEIAKLKGFRKEVAPVINDLVDAVKELQSSTGGAYYGFRLGFRFTAQPEVSVPVLVLDGAGNQVDTDGDGNADTQDVLGRGGFAGGLSLGFGGGYANATKRLGGVLHLSPMWEKGSTREGESTTYMGLGLGADVELGFAVDDDNTLFLGPVLSFENHSTGARPDGSDLSSWDIGVGPGLRWEVTEHGALVTNILFQWDHYSTKVDGDPFVGDGLAATLNVGFELGFRPGAKPKPQE